MNILLVYKEADIATYKMLEGLSKLEDFNIYIASPQSYTDKKIYGNCTPLDLPVITSKFNWNVIRALRQIIKTYQIDLIYSPSSSGLSNALFASIGTRAKNIAYRGTQAKLKRFDPTYYLGILNPAVEHVVCETKDIEEYLSRFIARKRLTTSTKPFDIDWIKEAVRTPKQADDIPDDAFRCIYIGATKNRPFKGKYSINSLVYWVTYVHNVVYSFYRSMIYCYINSTQRCAGSIVIDIIPTNGADKRKFFPFAPYFPVTNVIKRYFYPYFPAIIGIKGYSFPYFPYLSGIMKIKTALYSLFSRLDWHKTVVFPCLGEIYEGIRSLSWEIPVT